MPTNEDRVYRRIGEFAVSFQWLEHRLREIGWFILDPSRTQWPPRALRRHTNEKLFDRVEKLFLCALPKCRLGPDLEREFATLFAASRERFTSLRRARNRILHSAFVELKAGDEVQAILRTNQRLQKDAVTGEPLFDSEILSEESFKKEMLEMAELAVFLNRCYIQLIHGLPTDDEAQ